MTPPISLTIATTRSWPLCDISLSWQCLYSGEWYPSSVSVIPHIWASFGLLIKTVILLMLHSTPFALWTSQWNRICEWSVIVLSTTNKRIISLSLTCKRNTTCNLYCFQTTLKYHFPAHSLCFLDTIIQPNQHHSPEYPKPSCIDIIIISPICNWNPTWHYPLHSINTHRLFPFHMISIPRIQTHSHSQLLKHTPTASILATLCNPWFQ